MICATLANTYRHADTLRYAHRQHSGLLLYMTSSASPAELKATDAP